MIKLLVLKDMYSTALQFKKYRYYCRRRGNVVWRSTQRRTAMIAVRGNSAVHTAVQQYHQMSKAHIGVVAEITKTRTKAQKGNQEKKN